MNGFWKNFVLQLGFMIEIWMILTMLIAVGFDIFINN